MPQALTIALLVLALLLPVAGAVGLRLLAPYLRPLPAYIVAALIFVLSAGSTLTLANSNRTTLRVNGLTVLLPDSGGADMPTDLLPPISPPLESPEAAQTPIVGEPLPQPTTASTLLPTVVQSTPTRTPASATATVAQPTATTVLPTETAIPPTATTVPPTETAIPPTATASGPRRYTVQAGDTLRSIAERFGVTVQAILRANRLTAAQGDALRPGQEIIIP